MELAKFVPLAAAALAACGSTAPDAKAGSDAGTATPVAPSTASSAEAPTSSPTPDAKADQEAISVKIAAVVASYRRDKPTDFALSTGFKQVWNRALGNGALDFDPLCSCQDYDPAKFSHRMKSVEVEGDRAVAKFDLDPGWNEWQATKLTFVRENGDWLLDDIGSRDLPSLRRDMAGAAPGSYGIGPD
ncbi:MAG: DUF3828 domain-containing protein [Novosphingobium sp.]